jgi:hypothetical protein
MPKIEKESTMKKVFAFVLSLSIIGAVITGIFWGIGNYKAN